MSERKRVFFDMDGVLAQYPIPFCIEDAAEKGFFKNRPVMNDVQKMVCLLDKADIVDIYILSAVYRDEHSVQDKKDWLKQWFPYIEESNMIFVPYGERKTDYIPEKRSTDILVDDFTKNLGTWHGVGVKMYNGINGNYGTWSGYSLHSNMQPQVMYRQLEGIVTCA